MKNLKLFLWLSFIAIFTQAQNIYTIAGNGNSGIGPDGVVAINSAVGLIASSVAVDATGNVYIAAWSECKVRKVDINTGIVTTIAGTGMGGYNGDGIPASTAQINQPHGVAVDKNGNVYIAEYQGRRVRKIDASTGLISTVAGNGTYGFNGNNIPANTAVTTEISGIAVDTAGNVYFSDLNNAMVRKIDIASGLIQKIAGTGVAGYNGDNCLADTARLDIPMGVAVDVNGNVFVVDKLNQRVRKINKITGVISSIAGTGVYGYNGDGIAADTAQLTHPTAVAVDQSGNVYITESGQNRLRKIDGLGIINTISGTGTNGYSGDGGPASLAMLDGPTGICADICGNLYVSDRNNYRIRKITSFIVNTSFTNASCNGICNGSVSASASGGAGLYSYAWNGGLGPGSSYSNVCAGLYRVLVTDMNGCKSEGYVTVTEPALLTVSVTSTAAICQTPGSGAASVAGGTAPYYYSWSGGGGSNAVATGLAAGNYTVTVTDTNSCAATQTVTVANNSSTISVNVTPTNATCSGNGSANASASGGSSPYSYSWSSGATSATATGLSVGNYTVTATDTNGCVGTQTVNIAYSPYSSAPICMVTVDSASQYNIITWDKTSFSGIDSFIVMREITTNNYQPLASLPYNALSQFVDTVKTKYFPNTGDPNAGTYRYKLKMVDTCGNYSLMSPYHNTVYMLNNTGTFYWNQLYSIENSSNPVTSYVLLRDNNSNGNWQPVASVAGTQQLVSDPLYSVYQNTASWRVQTQWSISCVPTMKMQSGTQSVYSSSYSNVFSNVGIGVKERLERSIVVYPNPNNGTFTIEAGSLKKAEIEINDLVGSLVYKTELHDGKNQIVLTDLARGCYLLSVIENSQKITRRIVVE